MRPGLASNAIRLRRRMKIKNSGNRSAFVGVGRGRPQRIIQLVLSDLPQERAGADAETLGGLLPVAPGLVQALLYGLMLQIGQNAPRSDMRDRLAAVALENSLGQVGGQKSREQGLPHSLEKGLLQDALQLSDVTRPGVKAEEIHRFRGDFADIPPQSS